MKPGNKIANLGTILCVWAHPDDESWTAAGLLMAARANGQRVACVTATKGEKGNSDVSVQTSLSSVREQELKAALQILDISEHYWLDYHDGQCAKANPLQAASEIAAIIEKVLPDTIITFGPDGMTGHPDHKAVCEWAAHAAQQAGIADTVNILHVAHSEEWYASIGKQWDDAFNVFFMLLYPNLLPEHDIDLCFDVPPHLLDRKLQALKAQASQTKSTFDAFTPQQLRKLVGTEYFMVADKQHSH